MNARNKHSYVPGVWAGLFAMAAIAVSSPTSADAVGELVTFSAGTTARASEVNANFSALASAVNSNHEAIGELGGILQALQASVPIPVQLRLMGSFQDGSINLVDNILGPRSYTAPEGYSLRLTYVSCRTSTQGDGETDTVQIFLTSTASVQGGEAPIRVVEMITDNYMITPGLTQVRRMVVSGPVDAWLGVSTPGGPSIDSTVTLNAQRNANTGTGNAECSVTGQLIQQ